MTVYTIPVAFAVNADNEADAALGLARLLNHRNLIGEQTFASMTEPGHVVRFDLECWWTPNHPEADGSDGDERLTWTMA